jgi:hypothetical protein
VSSIGKDTLTGANINQNDIYRYYYGVRESFKIWIVDGAFIRKNILSEFNYGGNSQRYTFVPDSEIWIDNSISAEEFETTLSHQICERNLMANLDMGYLVAQDSSRALEEIMRKNYLQLSTKHEAEMPAVEPIGLDSMQEIPDLPDTIKLKNIYRIPMGKREGISIWIVDGYTVRREIFPDFAFSGNDAVYHFIPKNEVWIDGEVSCEETEYSIALELKERELIKQGFDIEDAYTQAVKLVNKMREENRTLVSDHPEVRVAQPLIRDVGEEE